MSTIRILSEFLIIAGLKPELRFGQIISNAVPTSVANNFGYNYYYMSDDKMFKYLHAYRVKIEAPKAVLSELEPVTLVGGDTIIAHAEVDCNGPPCCIHSPSDHHMKDWPQNWRSDRKLMERICEHGCGHPDPDDPSTDRIHGCCGCCSPKKGK